VGFRKCGGSEIRSIVQRRSISITHVILVLFLLICVAPGSWVRANVTAEFDPFSSTETWGRWPFYENYHEGQTFLATETGTLTSVEMTVVRRPLDEQDPQNPQDPVPLTVELYALSGSGVPTGSALASGVLAYDDPQFVTSFVTFKTIDMSPVDLVAGESYAIVGNALPSVKLYDWYSKFVPGNAALSNLYPDGCLIINNGPGWAPQSYDLGFRVNVDPIAATVPVPGALALGLIGVGLVRSRRWR